MFKKSAIVLMCSLPLLANAFSQNLSKSEVDEYKNLLIEKEHLSLSVQSGVISREKATVKFIKEKEAVLAARDFIMNDSILHSTSFNATKLNGKDISSGITLKFNGDKVSGRNSCNLYYGDYEINERGLMKSTVWSTKRICGQEVMNLENDFLKLFTGNVMFEKVDDSYRMISEFGTTAIIKPIKGN